MQVVEIKKTTLTALSVYDGDDLERAKMAFKGLSPVEMSQEHGQSGKTRQ